LGYREIAWFLNENAKKLCYGTEWTNNFDLCSRNCGSSNVKQCLTAPGDVKAKNNSRRGSEKKKKQTAKRKADSVQRISRV
jgi:hypothetical protein